jgi:hypothetical protein
MTALWYIDALDARAGMGLATCRHADLNTNTVDLGRPAVFIGPPFFQGESVASRAIGFAATRGSFQLGLFLGGEEIAFATLQGVCEFIRRVYISSGGGDTDSGISPAPAVPNPESGSGEFRSLPADQNSIARGMVSFVSSLTKVIASISKLKYSSSEPQELNQREATHRVSLSGMLGTLADVDALLAYGSAVLIEEMILRFPNRAADHGTWMRSMMKLGQMLSRLGLVDSLFRSPDFDRLWQMAYNTDKRFGLFNGHVREFDAVLPVMLGLGPNVPWHPRFGPPFWGGWHAGPGASEPLDDLSSFPIPSVAAKHVGLNPTSASARDLLSVFLADPTVFKGEQASRPEATMIVAFVLLSSMLIVSAGQTSPAAIDGTPIGGVLRQDVVRDAIVWMDSQMPGYLFHRDIEKYIRGASQLRYGVRPDESVSAQVTA